MHVESRSDLHIHKLSCCSPTTLLIICRFFSLWSSGEVECQQRKEVGCNQELKGRWSFSDPFAAQKGFNGIACLVFEVFEELLIFFLAGVEWCCGVPCFKCWVFSLHWDERGMVYFWLTGGMENTILHIFNIVTNMLHLLNHVKLGFYHYYNDKLQCIWFLLRHSEHSLCMMHY